MKKALSLLIVICFVFFSCKTTPEKTEQLGEIANTIQSENKQENVESNEQSNTDLSKPYGIADLPPVSEITDNQDEFFYGDELVFDDAVVNVLPQDDSDVAQSNETTDEIIQNDENQIDVNNINATDISKDEILSNEINDAKEEITKTEIKPTETQIANENTKPEIVQNTNDQQNINISPKKTDLENINNDVTNSKMPQEKKSTETNIKNDIAQKNINSQTKVDDVVSNKSETIDEKKDETVDEKNNETIDESKKEEIIPSRTINAKVNDLISFKYPGKGWIYLGETEQNNLVQYKNKQNLNNQVEFLIQAIKEGETVLHFYKMDTINNSYIDDYCKLIVNNTSTSSQIIEAPSFSYEQYLLKNYSTKNEDDENTSVQNNLSNKETSPLPDFELSDTEIIEEEPEVMLMNDIQDEEIELSSSDLLTLAYKNYNDKQFEEAYENISKYLDTFEEKIDEALLLKGQILEEPSSVRNIRDALLIYEQIISEYPQSDLWEKANQRIQYIKRFYFNIH